MKKIKTLKMNYEFKNVFSRGKYFVEKQLIIYVLKNKYEYNRIGVAVSTKLCNAVHRNRIKRVVRAAYQKLENNNECGYDIVFTWNKKESIDNLSFDQVYLDMEKAFKKSGISK